MSYNMKPKLCCCCDMRAAVMSANGIILTIYIILLILGTTVNNNDAAFKDCHDYCQADEAGRSEMMLKCLSADNCRKCYTEKWMSKSEDFGSNACGALAYGQSDKAKSMALASLVFVIIFFITSVLAIVGACTFNWKLVKPQLFWLPVGWLINVILAGMMGSELAKFDYEGKTPQMIFIAAGPIIGALVAAGLMYADKSLIDSGFTRQNYDSQKNCCGGTKPGAGSAAYQAPPVQATVVQATVVQAQKV